MDGLCNELVALKAAGGDPARQRVLEVQIEALDTQVRMAQENWPAVTLAIVYRSYNLHENSCEVAQALSVKPPHVRQVLARLNQAWKRMNGIPYIDRHGRMVTARAVGSQAQAS